MPTIGRRPGIFPAFLFLFFLHSFFHFSNDKRGKGEEYEWISASVSPIFRKKKAERKEGGNCFFLRFALVNKNWTRKIKNWTVKRGIYSTVHLTMSLGQREFGQERQAYVTRLPDMPDKAITPPTHCKAAFAA